MYKKIITTLLINSLFLISCSVKNTQVKEDINLGSEDILVFENNKVVGKINEQTLYDCTACYTINTIDVGKSKIKIKIPVSARGMNNQLLLQHDFMIDSLISNEISTLIKYSSTSSSKSYEVTLKQNSDYSIQITKLLTYNSATKDVKIGADDYAPFQSNFICSNEKARPVKDTITLNDSFVFTDNDCFDCPINYSIEDCVANRKNGVKMKWQ